MPSLGDSVFIFVLALMLFGPKKLPQLARQLGKLMAEFRRASNEFRMQMEDELRVEEQKEHQAKVDAMAGPPSTLPDPEHPHLPSTAEESAPIAESGELKMMPPSTGLPTQSGTYGTSKTYGEAGAEEVTEHRIMPPEHDGPDNPIRFDTPGTEIAIHETPSYGASSEEPSAFSEKPAPEPTPHNDGEHATHA